MVLLVVCEKDERGSGPEGEGRTGPRAAGRRTFIRRAGGEATKAGDLSP